MALVSGRKSNSRRTIDSVPASTGKYGIVVVGRGSIYNSGPEQQLAGLARDIAGSKFDNGCPVLVAEAVLEQGTDSFPAALDRCASVGVTQVMIVPVFLPVEHGVYNWLKFVARRWLNGSGSGIEVRFSDPLTGQSGFKSAIVEAVNQASVARPLSPKGALAAQGEAEWSAVPTHKQHVMFCQGPRCTAVGAGELGGYFRKQLREKGVDDRTGNVLAASTGCLYPCNLGPLMVVYPEGVWYQKLDEAAIDRIIDEHFIGGQVVQGLAYSPSLDRQPLSGCGSPFSELEAGQDSGGG